MRILAAILILMAGSLGALAQEKVGKVAEPLTGGILPDPVFCSPQEKAKIRAGYAILYQTVTTGFDQFVRCLDDAYLVEHDRKSARYIAGHYRQPYHIKAACSNLPNANASAPVHRAVWFFGGKITFDTGFLSTASDRRVASVMGHELAHNFGYRHKANPFDSLWYKNTVPEQVEACILNLRPNPCPPSIDCVVRPDQIVAMAIDGSNKHAFTWYKNGTVSAGSSTKLHDYRVPRPYRLADGMSPADVVGIAIDGQNNMVFAWYRNGTVSAGTTEDLGSKRGPYAYKFPAGKTIVDIAIDGRSNLVFAYYSDGTFTAGSTKDLASKRKPAKYVLTPSCTPAGGCTPTDVVGIGLDETNRMAFAWYRNGTVTAGTIENFTTRRPTPTPYAAGR